jgi:hypothetical protein
MNLQKKHCKIKTILGNWTDMWATAYPAYAMLAVKSPVPYNGFFYY